MMNKDRSYYRRLNKSELTEEVTCGVNVNWQELAIVLHERLEAQLRTDEWEPDHDE